MLFSKTNASTKPNIEIEIIYWWYRSHKTSTNWFCYRKKRSTYRKTKQSAISPTHCTMNMWPEGCGLYRLTNPYISSYELWMIIADSASRWSGYSISQCAKVVANCPVRSVDVEIKLVVFAYHCCMKYRLLLGFVSSLPGSWYNLPSLWINIDGYHFLHHDTTLRYTGLRYSSATHYSSGELRRQLDEWTQRSRNFAWFREFSLLRSPISVGFVWMEPFVVYMMYFIRP